MEILNKSGKKTKNLKVAAAVFVSLFMLSSVFQASLIPVLANNSHNNDNHSDESHDNGHGNDDDNHNNNHNDDHDDNDHGHNNDNDEDNIQTPTPTPTPEISPSPSPEPSQTGSITVCKLIVDSNDNINDGLDVSGSTFEIPSIIPSITSLDSAIGVFGDALFTAPLSLNSQILSSSEGNDGQCQTFASLPLGSYYYGQEVITSIANWLAPLYNDQYDSVVSSLANFFSFDSNLYDGNSSNDLDRNQNSDGHIVLSSERPDRTIVVLNKLDVQPTPTPDPESITSPTPTPTPTLTPEATPTPTPTPTPDNNTGGGGGGGSYSVLSGPDSSPAPSGSGTGNPDTNILGASITELPNTSFTGFDKAILSLFSMFIATGVGLVMKGYGLVPSLKIKK